VAEAVDALAGDYSGPVKTIGASWQNSVRLAGTFLQRAFWIGQKEIERLSNCFARRRLRKTRWLKPD
jgi:hypothetical protein